VKVAPANQTLILASEGARTGGASRSSLAVALRVAAKGATLTSVTVVAARPDAIVMLRADYSSSSQGTSIVARPGTTNLVANDTPPRGASVASVPAPSKGGALVPSNGGALVPSNVVNRDAHGNPQPAGRSGLSSYMNPVAQYARTQRSLDGDPVITQIDVHA
jgi:hypothetical protein